MLRERLPYAPLCTSIQLHSDEVVVLGHLPHVNTEQNIVMSAYCKSERPMVGRKGVSTITEGLAQAPLDTG